jgi:hypothetical protein
VHLKGHEHPSPATIFHTQALQAILSLPACLNAWIHDRKSTRTTQRYNKEQQAGTDMMDACVIRVTLKDYCCGSVLVDHE